MSKPAQAVTITRDSFLEPLGLQDIAARVKRGEERDQLYALTLEYADAHGGLEANPAREGIALNELPFKLPGLPVTVRLSDPEREELAVLLGLVLTLGVGAVAPGVRAIALTAALVLLRRVRRLRKQYGEASILEAISEARPATVENATLRLYGKPCRYPNVGCQFMDIETGACAVSLQAAEATVTGLEKAKVLRRLNHVPPYEYGIVL